MAKQSNVLVAKRVVGWLLVVLMLHTDLVLATQRLVQRVATEQEAADVIAASNFIQQITKENNGGPTLENRGDLISRMASSAAETKRTAAAAASVGAARASPPAVALSPRAQAIAARKRAAVPDHLWDLVDMNHPDFTAGSHATTLRRHAMEMHKRGAEITLGDRVLSKREVQLVTGAIETLQERFGDTKDAVKNMDIVGSVKKIKYPSTGSDVKELVSGLLVGFGMQFIPGLADVENGTAAMAFLGTCIDMNSWKEAASLDNQFGFQEEAANVSSSDLDEFAKGTAAVAKGMDEGAFILDDVLEFFLEASAKVWSVMKRMAAFVWKMMKWFFGILSKARQCGPVDMIIAIVIMQVLALFPPFLVVSMIVNLLMKLAQIAMLVDFVMSVIELVKNVGKNWFIVGKNAAKIIGYIIIFVVAYKNRQKTSEPVKGCTQAQQETCKYKLDRDEMKNWDREEKLCPAGSSTNTCNKFYKRDYLIDPNKVDDKGRTNLMRMKQGVAPIGPDGQSMELHHVTQTQDGPIAELSHTYHKVNSAELHTFLKPGQPSRIDRPKFDALRTAYWRVRAEDFTAGASAVSSATPAVMKILPSAVTVVKGLQVVSNNDTQETIKDFVLNTIDSVIDGVEDTFTSETQPQLSDSPSLLQDGLGRFSLMGLMLATVKGSAADKAEDDEKETRTKLTDVNSKDRVTALHACSNTATCNKAMTMKGESVDQVDGEVDNGVARTYKMRFAPDTGYALSAKVYVSDGGVVSLVRRDAAGRKREDVPTMASANGVRQSEKKMTSIFYYLDAPKATHQFTLQQCDGFGDYELLVTGEREPAEGIQSEDPDWKEFYAKNGQPLYPNRTQYQVITQYLPYPNLPMQRVEITATSHNSADIVVPAMDSNLPESDPETHSQKYHVLWTTSSDLQVLDVCDALRATDAGLLTLGGSAVVAATPYDAAAPATVQVHVSGLPESSDVRLFVLAENEGGAQALYGAWGDERQAESAALRTKAAPATGGMIGLAVAMVILAALFIAIVAVYAVRLSGVSQKPRLPFFSRQTRRFVIA